MNARYSGLVAWACVSALACVAAGTRHSQRSSRRPSGSGRCRRTNGNNRAKDKLRGGGTVLVFNPNFPSPALVEHAGALGFDVAFIDCEHGSAGFEHAEELARAARAAGMT